MRSREESLSLLQLAGVFFDPTVDRPDFGQTLNLNDTFGWAMAYGRFVPDEELPRVAELFCLYGWGGIYYWEAQQPDGLRRSEFYSVNRAIEFVEHEEKLRAEMPSSSKRAYAKITYTITGDRDAKP